MVGKFLAAVSPWPVTLLLSVPYVWVLGQGDDSIGNGLVLGALLGGLLAIAFTGLGMALSIWSTSNRASLFTSLLIYLGLPDPHPVPRQRPEGRPGYLVQQLNPLQASSEFLEKVLVNNRTVSEKAPYLMAAIYAAVGVLVLLFLVAPPASPRRRGTQAEVGAGAARGAPACWPRRPSSCCSPHHRQGWRPRRRRARLAAGLDRPRVQDRQRGRHTALQHRGHQHRDPSHPWLERGHEHRQDGPGRPGRPEDWSPERTQQLAALAPGASAKQCGRSMRCSRATTWST